MFGEAQGLLNGSLMNPFQRVLLSLVWRLRAGAYQEEAARGPLLCADLPHRRCFKEDASYRPQHVLSCRPGAHQPRQDQILTGTFMCLKPTGCTLPQHDTTGTVSEGHLFDFLMYVY